MQTGGEGNPNVVYENGPVEVKRARLVFAHEVAALIHEISFQTVVVREAPGLNRLLAQISMCLNIRLPHH
jgi:hypothetical protein